MLVILYLFLRVSRLSRKNDAFSYKVGNFRLFLVSKKKLSIIFPFCIIVAPVIEVEISRPKMLLVDVFNIFLH
jgi:hypothetical protein